MGSFRLAGEAHHHTPEQISLYAGTAVNMADELELSPEDRAVLLPALVTLLAAKQVWYEQPTALPNFAIPRNHRG